MIDAIGPYMNEDGDWWVPTTLTLVSAQEQVDGCIDSTFSKAVFVDIEFVTNHEHELGEWDDESCIPQGCKQNVECWHFVEEEKSWEDEVDDEP